MTPSAGAAAGSQGANPWLIAIVVTLATFMEVLDSTIVNVALPHIAGTMSATTHESTWTLTSYLVSNGIVLTISGALTRLLGRKRYFLICIAMFTVCSLLCGISTSLGQLIVYRLLQGFFGGGLQPNQQAIILDTFAPSKRSQAFAMAALATIVAPILGPAIGGWITDHFSWRWIFLINIPVGAITFVGVTALVRDPPAARPAGRRARFDFVGLGFIVLGIGAFQIMLDRGEDADWFNASFIRLLAGLAVLGVGGAIVWLLHASQPIVNLRVFANRNFTAGALAISALSVLLYSSVVLLPQLSETQFGYTATLAGLILIPGALVLVVMIATLGRVIGRLQPRFVIAFGFAALGAGFLLSQQLTPDIGFRTFEKMRILQTAGLAFLFVPISVATYATMPPTLNADAVALYTMLRNVSGSIGISVSTALLTTRGQAHMAILGAHQTPYSQPYLDALAASRRALEATGLPGAAAQQSAVRHLYQQLIGQSQIQAYMDVYLLCAVLAFCAVPAALLFAPARSGARSAGQAAA